MTSWQWQERVLSHMKRRGGDEGAVVVHFRVFKMVYFYMWVVFFLGGVALCCSVGVGICVTVANSIWWICCTFLKPVVVVAWCEHFHRKCCVILRYWNMCDCCVYCFLTLEEGGGSLV